jgi:hypothetical protein
MCNNSSIQTKGYLSLVAFVFFCTAVFAQDAAKPEKGHSYPTEIEPVSAVLQAIQPLSGIDNDENKAPGVSEPFISFPAWTNIKTEDFEGAFPNEWNVFVNGSGFADAYWDDTSARAHTGSWSAHCSDMGSEGGYGGPYANNMDAWMVYGPFDLSDATSAEVLFQFWNQSEADYDFFSWMASVNGTNFYGWQISGTQPWNQVTYDISDRAGQPNVWFAFRFRSDLSVTYEGTYVDEVVIRKELGPDIRVEPSSFSPTLDAGTSTVRNMRIYNDGPQPLNWSIAISAPTSGPADDITTGMWNDAVVGRGARMSRNMVMLRDKAQSDGHVPVIVGFDVAFQPEGNLDVSAAQNQRGEIAALQARLRARLNTFGITQAKWFETVPYAAFVATEEVLDALASMPEIVSIEEDIAVPPSLDGTVPLIGAESVHNLGYDGSGQAVAILDTGVDKTHAFLTGAVVSEACYSTTVGGQSGTACPNGLDSQVGTGAGVPCDPGVDGCSHGTHVAGIAAGMQRSMPGVAPGADVIAVQVFSEFLGSYSACGGTPCALSYSSDQILGMEHPVR